MEDSANKDTVVYLSDIRRARTLKGVLQATNDERVRELASEGYRLIIPLVFAVVAYEFLKAQNKWPNFQEELAEALFSATHERTKALWKLPMTIDISYDCYNALQELNYTEGLRTIKDQFVREMREHMV